jgi:hypothetical protein
MINEYMLTVNEEFHHINGRIYTTLIFSKPKDANFTFYFNNQTDELEIITTNKSDISMNALRNPDMSLKMYDFWSIFKNHPDVQNNKKIRLRFLFF